MNSRKPQKMHLMLFTSGSNGIAILYAEQPGFPVEFELNKSLVERLIDCKYTNEETQSFGFQLYNEVLPKQIKEQLLSSNPTELLLHMDDFFSRIPWENIYDGGDFWHSRYKLNKRRLGDTTEDKEERPSDVRDNISRAEYRIITALFCDIVGSTAILEKVNTEEWTEFLNTFKAVCTDIVADCGGHLHQFFGDGMLAYFGYPETFEDSAVRAVRCGLQLLKSLTLNEKSRYKKNFLSKAGPVKVRLGIHTGEVVVRGDDLTATGLSVAIASRLQEQALPNQILISEDTKALVAQNFEIQSEGEKQLKGVLKPKICYRVIGDKNKFTADKTAFEGGFADFYGREEEIKWLMTKWSESEEHLKTILIHGEAGIGKSRLIFEFLENQKERPAINLVCFCSSYRQNSSLYPIVIGFQHILGIDSSMPSVKQLARIESFFSGYRERNKIISVLVDLLGINANNKYSSLEGSSEQVRRASLDILKDWFINSNEDKCLIIEDVHWIDPTSLELLTLISNQDSRNHCFVILTIREEFLSEWRINFETTNLLLTGLKNEAVKQMLLSINDTNHLASETIDLIIKKTDGVPLFIEESARMAVDVMKGGKQVEDLKQAIPFPKNIHDLLITRLQGLDEAKVTAQVAAVVGRYFSLDILSRVSPLSQQQLQVHVETLIDSGLVLEQKNKNEPEYIFKHALVRDAAYQSLLKTYRRELHQKIAEAIENQTSFPNSQAELLAYHFHKAEIFDKAAKYWIEAAHIERRCSSYIEAQNHYKSALSIMTSPDFRQQDSFMILKVYLSLASCYVAIGGYSDRRVGKTFSKAEKLAIELKDQQTLIRCKFGQIANYQMRGDFDSALALAKVCNQSTKDIDISDNQSNKLKLNHALARAQSSCALASVYFHQGYFNKSVGYFKESLKWCDQIPLNSRTVAQDPGVMAKLYLAWYQFESGHPDLALTTVKSGVELAKKCAHPFGVSIALSYQANIHLFRGEYAETVSLANQSISKGENPGFKTWLAWSLILRGRANAELLDDESASIRDIEKGLEMWEESDAIVTYPFNLTLLSQVEYKFGHVEKARESIERARKIVADYKERYYFAEVERTYAKILIHQNNAENLIESINCLENAIEFAVENKIHVSALRAMIDLHALLSDDQPKQQKLAKIMQDLLKGMKTDSKIREITQAKLLIS